MNHWLISFTGTTWDQFRTAGANVAGANERFRKSAGSVKTGDLLLCYLTGVQRWVGVLEVLGPSEDLRPIWGTDQFPVRFAVKPILQLDAAFGVLMGTLEGRVDWYRDAGDRVGLRGFVRRSPNRFKRTSDGELLIRLLREASATPVERAVDKKKLARKPYFTAEKKTGPATQEVLVSIPGPTRSPKSETSGDASDTKHTEIQYELLTLGHELGLKVWVAKNDRSRSFGGRVLGQMPGIVERLPTQFNPATTATIELIDVLWLKGNSIAAAFEIECTTSVYSGLLRMSDLLALQPNLDIRLFLVAPAERRAKVEKEILRPTFAMREKPVASICGFIEAEGLLTTVSELRRMGLAKSLKADFMQDRAEYFQADRGI